MLGLAGLIMQHPVSPEEVVSWRLRHGLTYVQAAVLLGCEEGTVNSWEQGQSRATRTFVEAMNRVESVGVQYLLVHGFAAELPHKHLRAHKKPFGLISEINGPSRVRETRHRDVGSRKLSRDQDAKLIAA